MLSVALLLACCFSSGFGSLPVASYPFPSLTVTPAEINFAFTPTAQLTVTCQFESTAITLSSLSLERTVDGITSLLMTAENGGSLITTPNLDNSAVTNSDFEVSGSPKLVSFALNNPGQQQLGRYACRPKSANSAQNDILRPVYYQLNSEELDFDRLINELFSFRSSLNSFDSTLNSLPAVTPQVNYSIPIADLNERIDNLTAEIEMSENNVTTIQDRVETNECESNATAETLQTLDSAIYLRSDKYQDNTTYLLSQYSAVTFLTAEGVCKAHGGFLAEIDNQDEFDFITNNFLDGVLSDSQVVLFGARFNTTLQKFVNRESGNEITYSNYFFVEPNGNLPSDECLALYAELFSFPGIKMEGTYCDFIPPSSIDYIHSFLCEIPDREPTAGDVCGSV